MISQSSSRILHVDDHVVFRECLARALRSDVSFDVNSCGSSREALELLSRKQYDLVLADFDLGSETALQFLRTVTTKGSGVPRVAVLTAGMTKTAAREIAALPGMCGLLIKDMSLSQLVESIEVILQDRTVFDNRYVAALMKDSDSAPTEREADVVGGLVAGLSNKEIAAVLLTSEATVKNALQGLFRKYNVRTRSQLVRIALEDKTLLIGHRQDVNLCWFSVKSRAVVAR
jgi:DNA-binding NarL/FixJ family response regulator